MEFKKEYDYFLCKESGIVIDDAYDLYKKNEYKKYIINNNISFIRSQDNCIDYLSEMPDIKYVSLPSDVEDLSVLYELKKLDGICLSSSAYNRLDLSRIKTLSKLEIEFDSKLDKELLDVEELKLVGIWYFPKLSDLKFGNRLKKLELSIFKNLKILENIPLSLNSLTLDYCSKLRDVSLIANFNNLLELKIYDCNKIENLYESLIQLKCIESLELFNKETQIINHLKSISFMNNMANLNHFISDYIIDDNDLKPLLKVKNKELFTWRARYNIKI